MKVKIVNKSSFSLPDYKTKGSSGIDLHANIKKDKLLKPLERALIPTGIFLAIPEGYEGQVRPRSGLALKHGITLANAVGTIDSDYRGEVKVIVINLGSKDFLMKKGDRIAQLVFGKYEKVDFIEVSSLNDTKRGSKGFGHTGY